MRRRFRSECSPEFDRSNYESEDRPGEKGNHFDGEKDDAFQIHGASASLDRRYTFWHEKIFSHDSFGIRKAFLAEENYKNAGSAKD